MKEALHLFTLYYPSLFRNDKKMDRILTGIGDGCDNCLVKKALWTDITTIDAGFSCDRTLECIKETYEKEKL